MSQKVAAAKLQRNIVADLILWIDKEIHNNITVSDVAAKAGYSRWHVQRVFKRYNNCPLAKYIRERKLYLAATALVHTSDSILDVAVQYGFESQQTFTRQFLNNLICPPGAGENITLR